MHFQTPASSFGFQPTISIVGSGKSSPEKRSRSRKSGAHLDAAAAGADEDLDGGGVVTAGKLLLLRFAALDDRNGQQVRVDAGVQVQNVKDLRARRQKQKKKLNSPPQQGSSKGQTR